MTRIRIGGKTRRGHTRIGRRTRADITSIKKRRRGYLRIKRRRSTGISLIIEDVLRTTLVRMVRGLSHIYNMSLVVLEVFKEIS